MLTPRYRIGNDLTVFWAIHNRDGSPFDMAGKDVHLFVTNERGRKEVKPILTKLPDGTINNVVRWDFKGDDQRVLGVHTLTVEIVESLTHREITKDYCEAFVLVSTSEQETDEGDANITIGGDLILSSQLDIYRFEDTNADVAAVKEALHEVQGSLKDINDSIGDISEESLNIKVTINGIQSSVNDLGTEVKEKASATSVIELGEQVTEVQTNVYEQTKRIDGLAVELTTKASAKSVTAIGESLEITNEAVAEQKTRVDDLSAEISTKASADMVTDIADDLKITNEAVAEQTIKVNALSSEISTKASAESVAELEAGLQATSKSLAEQTIKVSALESEIDTKASTESVTSIGDSINVVSETVAEQKIRTDNIEASIENLVTKEVFNAATGEIEAEFASVKQTTDSIETTIKSQSGEIASIKETASGLSIGLGNLESDLDSLRNQMDGVTESYFDDYTPSNTNEPAASWIAEGKEAEHKGDTFTNTAVEGEDAGKSWRWLQDANGEWSWHPIADTDAQKALALAAQAQAAADGKVTIFYVQPSNYKEGDIWFVHNNEYAPYEKGEILTAIRAGSAFSISDWESKTRYTQAVKDLDEVMNTTFKDGVLDEAERITIVESLAGITSEKSAVDARYNITIVNTDFTDITLKNEYKATKSAYDATYNDLVSIVERIADATDGLKDLFDEYVSVSESYAKAYAEHTEKEAEVTEALMGRLNSASVYLDNITNDGILTPIEKEQLFEIYRNIAKEYDATRSNAYNYKIWKYNVNGVTEEVGINGGDGRYESYVAFKNAYASIATAFGSNIWGFTKMNETTELPDGYSTTLLKGYLDAYYEANGTLTESFSAITAAIEAAQKAAEATLKELTDNLLPEEMSTLIGKGVVLSTIIATKDVEGKITAGMNASAVHADDLHGRVVFVGGARDINNFNDASFVVYEDGHVKMQSADIAEYASRIELMAGLETKADLKDLDDVIAAVQRLNQMWHFDEDGNLVTTFNVISTKEISAGGRAEEGESSDGLDFEDLQWYLDQNGYVTENEIENLIPDNIATKDDVDSKIDLALESYATLNDVDRKISDLVDGAPTALDTLKEIADALENNEDSIGTILNTLDSLGKQDATHTSAIQELQKNGLQQRDDIQTLQGRADDHDEAIEALDGRVTNNATEIENMAILREWYRTVGAFIGKDEHGIYTDFNFRSSKEISAGGAAEEGEEGEGGTTTGEYKMYHHSQGTAAKEWRVEHGLGKYPNVRIVDSNRELCFGDVKYINDSVLTITFGAAFAGDAYCD